MAHPDIIVECEETIERSPADVWDLLVPAVKPDVVPSAIGDASPVVGGVRPGAKEPVEVLRPSPQVLMEQRVVGRDDRVMLLRYEMTRGRNLPWCAYESSLRVEPMGSDHSRVVVTALVTPAGEPPTVTGILRGLILLSLRSLKARAEGC